MGFDINETIKSQFTAEQSEWIFKIMDHYRHTSNKHVDSEVLQRANKLVKIFSVKEPLEIELHYKDVSLISVANYIYLEHSDIKIKESEFKFSRNLVNRLGYEIYDCPQDENNGH